MWKFPTISIVFFWNDLAHSFRLLSFSSVLPFFVILIFRKSIRRPLSECFPYKFFPILHHSLSIMQNINFILSRALVCERIAFVFCFHSSPILSWLWGLFPCLSSQANRKFLYCKSILLILYSYKGQAIRPFCSFRPFVRITAQLIISSDHTHAHLPVPFYPPSGHSQLSVWLSYQISFYFVSSPNCPAHSSCFHRSNSLIGGFSIILSFSPVWRCFVRCFSSSSPFFIHSPSKRTSSGFNHFHIVPSRRRHLAQKNWPQIQKIWRPSNRCFTFGFSPLSSKFNAISWK